MSNGSGVFHTLFEKLERFLRTETVMGEPFKVGEITMIPIISVSFGVAGGEGKGKDNKGSDGSGYGGGTGCKITPNAILVIKNDEVSVLSLTGKGTLERIVEMVPEIMAKLQSCKTQDMPDTGEEQ